MNDTLGPDGLVPSSLVFDEYPKVYTPSEIPTERITVQQRAGMLQNARAGMQRIMAKSRISRAMKSAVLPAADNSYEPGSQVLVWCEKVLSNRI
eukprot:IDg6182t1